MKNLIPSCLALAVLWGCQPAETVPRTAGPQAQADNLFRAYFDFKIQINPIEATKAGDRSHNDRLVNYISDAQVAFLREQYAAFLAAIDEVPLDSLSDADQLSLRVMRWDCQVKKQGLENALVLSVSPVYDLPHFTLMPIGQISSFQLEVGQLASGEGAQPFETVQDYEAWLQRMEAFVGFLQTARTNMERGMEQGIVLPRSLIIKISGQLDAFANNLVEEHLFYQPVTRFPDSFSPADRNRLRAAYAETISQALIPAYQALKAFMDTDYLAAGRETSGIGALPGGAEAYQYLITYHTSTSMSPDEIFELGQREVERISAEMEQVKEQVGFEGDLKAFFDHVRTRKELMPFTEPQQVIESVNAIHERIKPNLATLFSLTPKAGFAVRRTEAFREASASAEYTPGSKDGSRPGTFYIPIPDVKAYNRLADEALFLHEAIPGHHYQLSLQQENESLPAFLHAEGMGVFVEGWALYAESLGKELGLYKDPYQYFGMLSEEMHRAIRLVVDAGMHAKGWTREQAIQYSLDHEAASEDAIEAEIERYMFMPAQALSYKIGQLKIRELRSRAEQALGDRFDIREFHSQVLGSGSLPLVLLEEKIDRWIALQQG